MFKILFDPSSPDQPTETVFLAQPASRSSRICTTTLCTALLIISVAVCFNPSIHREPVTPRCMNLQSSLPGTDFLTAATDILTHNIAPAGNSREELGARAEEVVDGELTADLILQE